MAWEEPDVASSLSWATSSWVALSRPLLFSKSASPSAGKQGALERWLYGAQEPGVLLSMQPPLGWKWPER